MDKQVLLGQLNIKRKTKRRLLNSKLLNFVSLEILFFFNGIVALLGWNAVLSSLDYFQYVYSQYNVYQWFPLPVFIASVLISIGFNYISKKVSNSFLIKSGIIATNISLIILFILSVFCQNNNYSLMGFLISIFLCFMVGLGGNIFQLSILALINFMSSNVISKYNIGSSFGSIVLLAFRIFIILISGGSRSQASLTPIIIYFAITIAINTFDILLNIYFLKSPFYEQLNKIINNSILALKIQQENNYDDSTSVHSSSSNNTDLIINNSTHLIECQNDGNTHNHIQEYSFLQMVTKTSKIIFPYDLFLFFNSIITFILYPGPLVKKIFFQNQIYSFLALATLYKFGDILGRWLTQTRYIFNPTSIFFMLVGRIYFLITITLIANNINDILINNSIFPMINSLLFGITNGIVLNASYILIFQKSPPHYKKYSGILGGIVVNFGILVGSIITILYQKLLIP